MDIINNYLLELFNKSSLNICIGILSTNKKLQSNNIKLNNELGIYVLNNNKIYYGMGKYLGNNIFGNNSISDLISLQSNPSKENFYKYIARNESYKTNNINDIESNLKNKQFFINIDNGDNGFLSLFCYFESKNIKINDDSVSIDVYKHFVKPVINFTNIYSYYDLDSTTQSKIRFK